MNLEKLHVQNWGPHKDITVDLNAPIAGIIGANGKGKSFLLQAISYAVTGALPLNKERYIREYDPTNDERSGKGYKATVTLHFSVGGESGKIVRSISDSSSTRELHWKGEVYKKLTDVDSIIEELLGADKAAMQNAVFIKQGELTDMVKGTPATRQEIFRRLMNLNFLSSRYEEVQSKLRLLDGMGRDVSGEVSQLESMLSSWQDDYEREERNCKNLAAATKAKELLQKFSENNNYIRMLTAQKGKYQDEVTNTETLLVQTLGGKSIEEFEEEFEEASNNVRVLERQLSAIDELKQLQDVLKTYTEQKAHNDDIQKKLNGFSLDDYDNAILFCELQKKLNDSNAARDACSSKLAEEEKSVEHNNEALLKDKAKLDSLNQDMQKIKDESNMILYHLDIVTGKRTGAVCVSCNRPLDVDHLKKLWGAENLEEHLREKYKETTNKESACQLAIVELSHSVMAQEEAINKSKANAILNRVRIKELDATISEGINESAKVLSGNVVPVSLMPQKDADLPAFIKTLKEARTEHNALQMSLYSDVYMTGAKKQADSAAEKIQAITAKFPELPDVDTLEKEISKLNSFLSVTSVTIRNGKDMMSRLKAAEENVASYGTQMLDKEKEQKLIMEDIKAFTVGLPTFGSTVVETIIETAYEKLQESTQAVAFLNKTIVENQEKLEQLIEVQRTNAKIAQVQQELRDLKDILARDGLPMSYMQSVFYKIKDRVQQILQQIGANFQVDVDTTQPCTFTFYRTDSDHEYMMAQEMLSGGQAVRLALALLLACQQLILPDVGLLVLDEPTSHVDQAGVESMRALFQEMSSLLANSGMQLIVVDHNEELQAGFVKTTVL